MGRYHGAVHESFRLAAQGGFAPQSIVIYGEYFGGWFPHPAVQPQGPGAGSPVQKGAIAYSPDHNFYAFDVCVNGHYLDFDEASELLHAAGFPLVASPVVRGSFEECMAFDVDSFQTTMPALLGLPLCEQYSIAEGLIVRPVRRREAWMVKRKSVQYLETCPQELRKWITKCADSPSDGLNGLYLCLCREPRLQSVISKQPQLREERTQEALTILQQLYREDVEVSWRQRVAESGVKMPAEHCLRDVREVADRRVAVWLGFESSGHQMNGEHRVAASVVEDFQQERGASHQTHIAPAAEIKMLPAAGRQSLMAQKRIDPENGQAYTLEEMLAIYSGQYTKSATTAYWETCKVIGGHRRDPELGADSADPGHSMASPWATVHG